MGFHRCSRWRKFDLPCPISKKDHGDLRDPRDDEPPDDIPFDSPLALGVEKKKKLNQMDGVAWGGGAFFLHPEPKFGTQAAPVPVNGKEVPAEVPTGKPKQEEYWPGPLPQTLPVPKEAYEPLLTPEVVKVGGLPLWIQIPIPSGTFETAGETTGETTSVGTQVSDPGQVTQDTMKKVMKDNPDVDPGQVEGLLAGLLGKALEAGKTGLKPPSPPAVLASVPATVKKTTAAQKGYKGSYAKPIAQAVVATAAIVVAAKVIGSGFSGGNFFNWSRQVQEMTTQPAKTTAPQQQYWPSGL